MNKKLKTWTVLGTALATSTGAMAAGSHTITGNDSSLHNLPDLSLVVQVAGEGEGAEATANSEVAFLTNLGLVEGHLKAGVALYLAGESDLAKVHMKHPKDELYVKLEPELAKRNSPGFAEQLSKLAASVESGAPKPEVEANLADVVGAIAKTSGKIGIKDRVATMVQLVRTAGEEYAVGVADGKVVDPKEYQDAYGFVQTAKRLLAETPDADRTAHSEQIAEIEKHLATLDGMWPDISGKSAVNTDPTLLAASGANIELAGLSMK